jgi:hypothetical protein
MPRKNPPTKPDPRQAELDAWLDKHNARCMWDRKLPNGTIFAVWQIGNGIAVTMRYANGGWEMFTGCGDGRIGATLADAEERLGLTEKQHGWKEAHVYGDIEPPIWMGPERTTAWTEEIDGDPNLVAGDEEGVATAYLPFGLVRHLLAAHKPAE